MSQKARDYYKFQRARQEQSNIDLELCAECHHSRIGHIGEKDCTVPGCACKHFVEPIKPEGSLGLTA